MRTKSLFLILACVCGAIAAVGASQMMQGQGTPSVAQTTDIFVASRVIEPSEQITPGMMTLESWPADRVPAGTTPDLSLLEGKYAGQRLFAGEPMMVAKLVDSANGIRTQIPDGFSVVSMRCDVANSIVGLVRPGDRVNVIGYFTKCDQVPETGVKTVLRGVKVYAVNGQTSRSDEPQSRGTAGIISLLIYNDDEEAWTFASELGRIRLTLSGPDDAIDNDQTRHSGLSFLQWLNDHQQASQSVAVTEVDVPAETLTTVAALVKYPPREVPPPVDPPVVERGVYNPLR